MSWNYNFDAKIIRENGEIQFLRGYETFNIQNRVILVIKDIINIKDPNIFEKNRFIVIEGPILVETDSINDIMYRDMNGRIVLNKNVKVLCWF